LAQLCLLQATWSLLFCVVYASRCVLIFCLSVLWLLLYSSNFGIVIEREQIHNQPVSLGMRPSNVELFVMRIFWRSSSMCCPWPMFVFEISKRTFYVLLWCSDFHRSRLTRD
jgi:hypothetical protein